MLSAIKEIGELAVKKEIVTNKPIIGKVLAILINADKQLYSGIDLEDFDSGKIDQYLFKAGASKGNVTSPCCPLTEPRKTYKKIEVWLNQCQKLNAFKDDVLIKKAFDILNGKKKEITDDIEQKAKDLPKKEGKFLTVKLNGKYLGEYNVFRKCLVNFEEAKRKKSSNTGTCSICGISDKEVSGKTDVFKFYTIDKPGFITGGFEEALAWKNYPVCLECKTSLENGKKFIDTYLKFWFYGLNYYLIPRLLVGGNSVLEKILNVLSDTTKTIRLKERIKKRITNDESEILEYLSEEKDVITLNFLFLKRQQSAERILLLIEDVFPSRIRKIFKAKDYVDRVFNNDSDKGFTFGNIRTFFSKSSEGKRVNDLNKYFLEIVDSVFIGRKLDFSFLLKFYMASIRREFINDGYFIPRVKDALMDTMFFGKLGLTSFEEEDMEGNIFEAVFKKFGKSFGSPIKRGVFLLGTLTQLLLNKQWVDRNAKPFMKYLKGLKLDEKDIKALLPKVQNKLEEYDSFDKGKRLIASEASKYLLEAGEGWKMSTDEINFYFACGMNLVDDIAGIVYPKTNKKRRNNHARIN